MRHLTPYSKHLGAVEEAWDQFLHTMPGDRLGDVPASEFGKHELRGIERVESVIIEFLFSFYRMVHQPVPQLPAGETADDK